jgi:hypothetical protein
LRLTVHVLVLAMQRLVNSSCCRVRGRVGGRNERRISVPHCRRLHGSDAAYGMSHRIYDYGRAPAGLRLVREKPTYRDEIGSIAMQRNVRYLLHFTQLANLSGIVKHGLLPRRDLIAMEDTAYVSDLFRLDGNDGAVSVSVSRWSKRSRRGCGWNWLA